MKRIFCFEKMPCGNLFYLMEKYLINNNWFIVMECTKAIGNKYIKKVNGSLMKERDE